MGAPQSRVTHVDLQAMAAQVMMQHGFEPDFPPAVGQQLKEIEAHNPLNGAKNVRDLRSLLWSSIDNDTSRDLDQIEVGEQLPNGDVKVMVGIADVDAFVAKGTPIDDHAAKETTSIYTGVRIFPMLPEELSTGASSLLEDQDRLAMPSILQSYETRRSLLTTQSGLGCKAVRPRRRRWPLPPNCRRNSRYKTKWHKRSRSSASREAL